MPGLLVVTWAEGEEERATRRFAVAREAFTRLKGLACSGEGSGPGFRMARFAGKQSIHPGVFEVPAAGIVAAVAGWWFAPDAGPGRSSPEWLAERYRLSGETVLGGLEGHFLAVLADRTEGRIVATTDRLGWFPAYVADDGGMAWICTSALALAVALRAPLDPDALRHLFMGNPIRPPRSAFKGIRRLGFGERITASRGHLRIERAWTPFAVRALPRGLDEAVDEGIGRLARSCREVRETWPRWISDLTSGLDSRLLVASMARLDGPVNVTVTGTEDSLDARTARAIADRFGWSLNRFVLSPDWGWRRWKLFEKGVALADGDLPGQELDRPLETRLGHVEHFDAALSGAGGEFLREYGWQQEFFGIGRTSRLDVARLLRYRFFFAARPDLSIFANDIRQECLADYTRIVTGITEIDPDALNTTKLDAIYVWRYSAGFGRYVAAIAHVMPLLLPLATPELVEFGIGVPWRYRLRGRLSRAMTTRLNPSLAAIPTWYGGTGEVVSLRRPIQYVRYAAGAGRKLTRKMSRLVFARGIFVDPTKIALDPRADRDFVSALKGEGLLDPENLRTAGLYDADGLRSYLLRASEGKFEGFDQLYTIISIEALARLAETVASGDKL